MYFATDITDDVRKGFMIAVIKFLSKAHKKFPADKRVHVIEACKKFKEVYSGDYGYAADLSLPCTPLKIVIAWIENIKVEDVKDLHQKINWRVIQFLQASACESGPKRVVIVFDTLLKLSKVCEGDPPDDCLDFLDVYSSYHALEHNMKGDCFLGEGQHAKSIEAYGRAMALCPFNIIYICNRAMVYIMSRQFDNAIADCHAALQLNPSCTEAYNHLGTAYVRQKMWKEAMRAFQEAAMIQPENPDFYEKIRLVYLQMVAEGIKIPTKKPKPLPLIIDSNTLTVRRGDSPHSLDLPLPSPLKSTVSKEEKCYPYEIKLYEELAKDARRMECSKVQTPISDSPSISQCTTATDISAMDAAPTINDVEDNKSIETTEENFKIPQPEIASLQNKEKCNISLNSNDFINRSSDSINFYPGSSIKKPRLFNQVLTSVSVALVSTVVGFVSAYTSPAADSIKKQLDISDEQVSWIGGLVPLGALVGGLAGGQLIELLGRKRTILFTDVLFMVSWIVIAVASNEWYLYVGRAIAGFSVGIASLALPVYLGETIQPEVRGTLGLLPTAFGNIGILICFVAGTYLSWRHLAWLGVVLPMPFLILTFLIPETPRWYISKGNEKRAYNSLQWLRSNEVNIQEEFTNLFNSQKAAALSPKSHVSELLSRSNLKPLLISLGLMFFQQLSGITAVIYYTTEIFSMSGSSIDEHLCTIIVGIVNFISTFIATILIDKLGRKVLLYISSISMIITLGTLGTYFYLLDINVPVSRYGWLPLASFVIYVLGFSLGFGPVPWLMLGEIFPTKITGSAASVATAFHWACTFIVTKTFMDIIAVLGRHGTFWMFAIMCLASLFFVILCVPETQGKSLHDIEKKFLKNKKQRTSSITEVRPMPFVL